MPSGSAYQGLILPAPKRAAPARPALPPVLPAPPHTAAYAGAVRAQQQAQQSAGVAHSYRPPDGAKYSSAGLPVSSSIGAAPAGLRSAITFPQLPAQQQAQQAQKAIQRVEAVSKFAKLLGEAPKLWKTGASSSAFDINPLAKGWKIGRTDMGLDANASPGAPILAPNDSKIVGYNANWYSGQPYMSLQFTSGPHKGQYYYVAEQITGPNSKTLANGDALPPVGTKFRQGEPIARYAASGTGIEIGYGTPTPGQTLAQSQGNTGDSSHNNAPAGIQFVKDFIQGGKQPGQVVPAGSPKVARGSAQFVSAITGKKPAPVPLAVPSAPGSGTGPQNHVSVILGAPLSDSQKVFSAELAKKTGLDPGVIAAWVHSEQPPTGLAPNGAHNWLNIGATDSGFYGANNPAWQNPRTAADFTAQWLRGRSAPGFGTAAPGIQRILSTAGQGPAAQIAALQQSGWAASGYPGLSQVYNSIQGTARLGTANVNIPAGSAAPSGGGGSVAVPSGGAPVLGTGSSQPTQDASQPQVAQQQAQQANLQLLANFLRSSNPWEIGPKTAGTGGLDLFSSGILPTGSMDLGSVALQSLQGLAGNVPLAKPSKKRTRS